MTKKDYIVFAEMLNDLRYGGEKLSKEQDVLLEVIIEKIGNIFADDNELFDIEKFRNAINKKV